MVFWLPVFSLAGPILHRYTECRTRRGRQVNHQIAASSARIRIQSTVKVAAKRADKCRSKQDHAIASLDRYDVARPTRNSEINGRNVDYWTRRNAVAGVARARNQDRIANRAHWHRNEAEIVASGYEYFDVERP